MLLATSVEEEEAILEAAAVKIKQTRRMMRYLWQLYQLVLKFRDENSSCKEVFARVKLLKYYWER